jgi:outer membrane protein OmpA-like peptidoglycan-associated protein
MVGLGAMVPVVFGVIVIRPILDGDEPSSASSADQSTSGPARRDTVASTGVATSGPPSTDSTSSAPSSSAPASTAAPAPVATQPDGSPQPVLAVFDGATITLSGAVPTREAADRLTQLALANSQTAATVLDRLTIDPTVPLGIGVRVVEMASPRFPEGSAEIVREHAVELDRVANVLKALPNVTVMVIGHADQRGAEDANFLVSEDRARAVVRYLVATGIAPSRLASRAVGETDLLTLGEDASALALNRRTEFVFYGLLLTP